MSALTSAELAHLRSLGVTGYKAAEVIERQQGLLREWVASATNIESGEVVAKVEQGFVEQCRRVLGHRARAGALVVQDVRGDAGEAVLTVLAEGHSDDWMHEVAFDAAPWFEQASDDELRALHEIGYRGDRAADEVLLYLEERVAEVGDLLDYCRRSQAHGRDGVGFECEVSEDEALRWLAAHRPGLLTTLGVEAGGTGGGSAEPTPA
jgi:hypothetical protein